MVAVVKRFLSVIALVACSAWAQSDKPPPSPGPESWTFRADLAKPVAYHAREAYRVRDDYGLTDNLETVKADLDRFMTSAARVTEKTLTLARGKVEGSESYRIEMAGDGSVRLVAEDDDGLRRGVCHFEDRVMAGDLRSVTRKPWLRHRISRCYFAPIKRPPFNRDELMDDVDYYPDEYLNRLAHEGVNGLWLTVELRDLVETSFTARSPDASRRLAKLRRTVEKCARYGIRTWLFCIEPRFRAADDPLVKARPEMFSSFAEFPDYRLLCPSSPDARRYVEEATADLFRQVPGLPGILNLSHGERPTTCLSPISPVNGVAAECPRCRSLAPGEIHRLTAQSFLAGMRKVNPKAELLSWFYQPHVVHERASWVADVPKFLPGGVTMIYNFESGAVKEQLGRYRAGGDYWLSYAGPSPAFSRVASSARGVGARFGAKIQVGCSHECATVPFVPVPGLLYRKYRAMREAGCETVMQCWYFGNYPGVMNKAAGELAFSDFSEGEADFLKRLAAPEWGADAAEVAALWQALSDAYENYPLSNDMQYYGPFHAGAAWPLEAGVSMKPLARTWKPQDPPSGDAIGECLENHTLEEAAVLAARMRVAAVKMRPALETLAARQSGDPARVLDVGVMKTLGLLFESGADVFDFYLHRFRAIRDSRLLHDATAARREVGCLRELVRNEKRVTSALLPLAKADSRIGFHSEAEAHQFHPARLEWRMGQLDQTLRDLDRIDAALADGRPYPLSEHEASAPALRCGTWTETTRACRLVTRMDSQLDPHLEGVWEPTDKRCRFRPSFLPSGDFVLEGELPDDRKLEVLTMDACGMSWPHSLTLFADGHVEKPSFNVVSPAHEVRSFSVTRKDAGWTFCLVLDSSGWSGDAARRPGWIYLRSGETPIWPEVAPAEEYRLNIGNVTPLCYGRIVCDIMPARQTPD